MSIKKGFILHELLWYAAGSGIAIIFSLLRSPIFTRHFTPEEYGYYTLIFVTYNFLSVLLFSWIRSCMWRYYLNYKKHTNLPTLFSSLGAFYLLSTLIMLVITITWYNLSANESVKKLILFSFFHFASGDLVSLLLIPMRMKKKAIAYNIIQAIRASASFGILCVLTFGFDYRIEAFVLSSALVNVAILLWFLFQYNLSSLSFHKVSTSSLKSFLGFGSAGLILNISLLLLNNSDRYILSIYENMDIVGIYNQIYNISNLSLIALIHVFFNAINPHLLGILEDNKKTSRHIIHGYLTKYVYLILPLTVYFSLYAKEVALIMLGEKFRSGYDMMPFIAFASFIYGLIMFEEQYFKFRNKFKVLILGSLGTVVLNIILNLIFIPLTNYKFAALSTLIAYVVLFVYYTSYIPKRGNWNYYSLKPMIYASAILTVQIIVHIIINTEGLLYVSIEATIFVLIYFLLTKKTIFQSF